MPVERHGLISVRLPGSGGGIGAFLWSLRVEGSKLFCAIFRSSSGPEYMVIGTITKLLNKGRGDRRYALGWSEGYASGKILKSLTVRWIFVNFVFPEGK